MRLKYLNFLLTFNFVFAKQQILNLAAYGSAFYTAAASFFFIQKADGTSHPLLKLSLLNFVKLRLESEVQFGEHGVSVFAAFFGFEVIVVEYANNVFSEGVACTVNHAFVTSFENFRIYETISGRADVSVSRLIHITYMQAIGTRFISGSTFPSKVNCPAVFIGVVIVIIAAHIFAGKNEIRSEVIA